MAHIRGLILLLVLFLGFSLLNAAWQFIFPAPPPPPRAPSPPPESMTFSGNVFSVAKVTRGGSFSHYDIKFTGASNGQDKLNLHKNVPEDDLRAIIGRRVTVTCLNSKGSPTCYWLTRLESDGREIVSVPEK